MCAEEAGERERLARQVAMGVQALYRSATALAARLTTASGLHPTDTRALELLDAAAEAPITAGALGAQLGLSSAAVTALIDRLERVGLAARERDTADRRRVHVVLTPTARSFGAEQLEPVQRRIARAIGELSLPELAAVARFLEVLTDEGHDDPG